MRFRSRRRRCGFFSSGGFGVSGSLRFRLVFSSGPDFARPSPARPDPNPRWDVEHRDGVFERDRSRPRVAARFFDLFFGDMVGFCVMEDAHHDAVNRVSMDRAEHVVRACAAHAPCPRCRVLLRLNEADATCHAM
jgi:hypothetical protein